MQDESGARGGRCFEKAFVGLSFAYGTAFESVSGRTGARGAREHSEVLENFARRGETMRLNPGIQKYRESAKSASTSAKGKAETSAAKGKKATSKSAAAKAHVEELVK